MCQRDNSVKSQRAALASTSALKRNPQWPASPNGPEEEGPHEGLLAAIHDLSQAHDAQDVD